ncbi:hypothetical protein [Nigerium massiliense]|uniref:hypothetical protein n=1 Tax=Nigerium massiliense TaxID=1522317 RepID=UPI0012FDB117|nr:hypothetical protein [Nigerium massiliense]
MHNYEPRHLQQAIDFLALPGAPTFSDVMVPPVPLAELPALFERAEPTILRRTVAPSA